jgi:hypothetical protein
MATGSDARLKALLTLHILTTVGLFGADLVLLTLGVSAVLGADPRTVYPAGHLIAAVVVQPLAIAAVATGVVLARVSGRGLLRYWWTAIKLGMTVAMTIVVVGVLVPRLGAAANATGGDTPRAFTLVERLPLAVAPAVASSLLNTNVALAIYKPRWKLRRASPEFARTTSRYA